MKELFPFDRYHFKSDHIFEGLPDDILKILSKNKETRTYKKGDTIFVEGRYPSGLYHVDSGMIKKFTIGQGGKEHTFYLCKQGEFLGHHSLLSNESYPDSAEAILDSVVSFIPKSDLFQAIDKSHTLCKKLLNTLSHEFGVFIQSTQILAQHPVRERTALALLVLVQKFMTNETDAKDVPIDMSRRDLASIIGTSEETGVRVLHDFKEDGLIKIEGRIIKVLDMDELKLISNYDT